MQPKVSVIIPIYGVEKYIERCTRSLFEQTLDCIEFLFIDDCSPDKSVEILQCLIEEYQQRIAKMHYNVKIIHMEHNSGQAAVRTRGIKLATGEYVIHCDSDDWVDLDMYRLMYEKAKTENADVVICDYYISNEEESHKSTKGCYNTTKENIITDMCTMRTSWALWNKLTLADLLHNDIIFPVGNMGEDMVITLQVLQKAEVISYIPTSLYYYFQHTSSITKRRDSQTLLTNYYQLKDNVDILIACLKERDKLHRLNNIIEIIKFNVCKRVWGFVHIKEWKELWTSSYPELKKTLLFNNYISIVDKLRYILTFLHLYPIKSASAEKST